MEDIFKVVFYTIAIAIWIVYKIREQKKSGAFKPRTEINKEVEKNIFNEKLPEKLKPEVINVPKPLKKEKYVPLKINKNKVARKDYASTEGNIIESYDSPFLTQILNEDLEQQRLSMLETENSKPSYQFNPEQAIIGSEILKRPNW